MSIKVKVVSQVNTTEHILVFSNEDRVSGELKRIFGIFNTAKEPFVVQCHVTELYDQAFMLSLIDFVHDSFEGGLTTPYKIVMKDSSTGEEVHTIEM